jgi:hypothetical protein
MCIWVIFIQKNIILLFTGQINYYKSFVDIWKPIDTKNERQTLILLHLYLFPIRLGFNSRHQTRNQKWMDGLPPIQGTPGSLHILHIWSICILLFFLKYQSFIEILFCVPDCLRSYVQIKEQNLSSIACSTGTYFRSRNSGTLFYGSRCWHRDLEILEFFT